jgi:hypothetical protein
MRKSIWLVLALLVLSGPPYAHADSFNVSGDTQNFSGFPLGSCVPKTPCSFSGALTVDVTAGTVTALDITFPGLAAFDVLSQSSPVSPSDWGVVATDSTGTNVLNLEFTTAMTPGSLVGFTGGNIFGNDVLDLAEGGNLLYLVIDGSITPAPEPSSLALIPLGLGALLVMRKRMGRSSRVTV